MGLSVILPMLLLAIWIESTLTVILNIWPRRMNFINMLNYLKLYYHDLFWLKQEISWLSSIIFLHYYRNGVKFRRTVHIICIVSIMWFRSTVHPFWKVPPYCPPPFRPQPYSSPPYSLPPYRPPPQRPIPPSSSGRICPHREWPNLAMNLPFLNFYWGGNIINPGPRLKNYFIMGMICGTDSPCRRYMIRNTIRLQLATKMSPFRLEDCKTIHCCSPLPAPGNLIPRG